jgi:sodium/pantothenate symporter
MQNNEFAQNALLLIIAYACLILFFVIRGAIKTKSIQEYAIGTKGFSPVILALSLAAGITSAATFIINPGFVAYFGWSAFLGMSMVLSVGLYASLIILSKNFRTYGHSVKAATLSQWIGSRFDSKAFGILMAVFSLLLITFIILICVGMTKVLSNALAIGEFPSLVVMVVFVFGYMMFGGANSMIYTNAIQACIMLLVAGILLYSGVQNFSGGISGFWEKISSIDLNLTRNFNQTSPLFRDWFEVLFCNLIIGIAIVCQPHIITRSLMLEKGASLNKFLFYTILFESVFFCVLFVGFYARIDFPDLTYNGQPIKMDSIMSVYVVKNFSNFTGLIIIVGLLSAGLSTLEGLIQSVSTTITSDLIRPVFYNKLLDDTILQSRLKWVNKFVIICLAVITIFWSRQQLMNPKLSVGILAQNGVYAYFSAAFVPVLQGIFLKNVPKIAPISAAITAILVHFSVYYGELTPYTSGVVKNPAVAATFAIISATVVGFGLYLFLGNSLPKNVEK